jgi:ectoine hydroxylase-related dioxygenase (phytanoyl-CoA dioxygenase family)
MNIELEREGFTRLPGFLTPALLEEARHRVDALYAAEGENAGAEFRKEENAHRLANLVDKGTIFEEMILMPEVLALVGEVLKPRFKLSSFNARSADPHSNSLQPLHADMGAIPDEDGYWVCNTVWMLDDFTPENGALRCIPGSHHLHKLPQDVVADLFAPHPDEILVTGKAGDVVVMNAHMWHGGTANRTANPRRALHAFYCRWDKPQQQYQKALLNAATQARMSSQLRELLALDDAQNDEISRAPKQVSGFLKK